MIIIIIIKILKIIMVLNMQLMIKNTDEALDKDEYVKRMMKYRFNRKTF